LSALRNWEGEGSRPKTGGLKSEEREKKKKDDDFLQNDSLIASGKDTGEGKEETKEAKLPGGPR